MATDDGDIDSSNPSADFKVGDFDRLSGFFTPVWESKKRIRSETPIPSSRPVGSAPAAGLDQVVTADTGDRATKRSPQGANTEATARTSARKTTRSKATSAEKSASRQAAGGVAKAKTTRRRSGAEAAVGEKADIDEGRSTATAAQPKPRATSSAGEPASARASQEAAAIGTTGLAAARQNEPELPPEAFFDEEPDFRRPRAGLVNAPVDKHSPHYLSLKASVAATRVHEHLRAKLNAGEAREAADTVTDLKAAPTPPSSADPLAIHLLRQFRRTIRLSTPLPEPIRSMIARSRNN